MTEGSLRSWAATQGQSGAKPARQRGRLPPRLPRRSGLGTRTCVQGSRPDRLYTRTTGIMWDDCSTTSSLVSSRVPIQTPSGSRASHMGTHGRTAALNSGGINTSRGRGAADRGMFDVRDGFYKARCTDSAVGARKGARSGREHRQGRTFGGGEKTCVSFPHEQAP